MDGSLPPTATPASLQNFALLNKWRAWLLHSWFGSLQFGHISVTLPSGHQVNFNGDKEGPKADLKIDDLRLVNKLIASGDLGLAESYIAGEWSTSNLAGLLRLGLKNWRVLEGAVEKSRLLGILDRFRHAYRANTKRGSRRNIAAHYDLGNDFYSAWLDPTMTYSSALFETMNEPLEDAQRQKYFRLAQQLNLRPEDRVLEIGCGWGGFAEVAAKEFGCQVVALTLSEEQARFARDRFSVTGLDGRVEIRLQDYRDVEGQFDKIVSIEMFEAVGEKYWPVYFDKIFSLLSSNGLAALQIITMEEGRFKTYRRNPDFIQRYIFPGGMLPSFKALQETIANAGLKINNNFAFGASYAETLRRWDTEFQANWAKIEEMGFDDRFFRMWRYYLCYCQVGFEMGQIDVSQFTIAHK